MRRKPEQIHELVEKHKLETLELRERMDEDYDIYKLIPFKHEEKFAGFKEYTSNEPRTMASKIISLLGSAQVVVRVPLTDERREERNSSNDKERFIIGCLRQADERLAQRLVPSVQEQLAFFAPLRGWFAGRALIVKDESGATFIDITPFDPRHIYWNMGNDGLNWAVYKTVKKRDEIEAEYGVKVPDSIETEEDNGVEVYDYYDDEHNIVTTSDTVLKKATIHGSPRTPVFIGAVGVAPPIYGDDLMTDDMTRDYGESIFHANREVYKNDNFMKSVYLELAGRSLKRPMAVTSRDGRKTLSENPYVAGAELSLSQDDKVELLDLMETTRDAQTVLGMVSGELQRGGLPFSLFGELQFQLSGFAINSLRQSIFTVIEPSLKAMKNAYRQIARLLIDQYATGSFEAISLSGRDRNRSYFNETILPVSLVDAGDIDIDLVASLPQDEPGKYQMAQVAREGPIPLLPDRVIHEDILGLQDPDLLSATIAEQVAESASPMAAAYTLMSRSEESGRDDLAQIYYGELQVQMLMKQIELMQAQMAAMQGQMAMQQGGAQPEMGGGQPRGGGMSTSVSPPQNAGVQGAPIQQQGPVVPPGSPRPGARQ
jgi:hypothetical protein